LLRYVRLAFIVLVMAAGLFGSCKPVKIKSEATDSPSRVVNNLPNAIRDSLIGVWWLSDTDANAVFWVKNQDSLVYVENPPAVWYRIANDSIISGDHDHSSISYQLRMMGADTLILRNDSEIDTFHKKRK
jgi:hypothetical protein